MPIVYSQNWDVALGGDSVTGNCTRITSPTYAGAGALRIAPTAAAAYWIKNSVSGTPNCLVYRVYVNFATLPTVDISLAMGFKTAAGEIGVYFDQTTGKLATGYDGVAGTGGGPVIVTDTWYCLDMKIDISVNPWTSDAQVDGVPLTQTTAPKAANTFETSTYRLGDTDTSTTYEWRADQLLVSHTVADYPLSETLGAYETEVISDAPAGYYRCDEASGLLQDSSGNARHATSSGGTATYQQTSPITSDSSAKAISFSGDDYFSVPDSAGLDFGDTFTLEVWLRRTRSGVTEPMLAKDTGAFALYIDTNDKVVLDKYGTGWDTNESGTTVDTDWHHFVATSSGAIRKLYKDGVDVTNNMTDMAFVSNASPLIIGSNSDFSDFWVGDLAEIALYPTALSQDQVQTHYNAAFADPDFAPVLIDDFNRVDPAFPVTTVLTSFTGSDENPLSEGGNWASPILAARGSFQRLSNMAQSTSGTTCQNYWTPTIFGETEVFVTIATKGTGTQWIDLWARIQTPNTAGLDGYFLEITNAAGNDTWQFGRMDNATATFPLATLTATEVAVGDQIGLRVTGTGATVTLAAWHKPSAGAWTLIGTYGDTHANRIVSAGYIGIETSNGSSWDLDNFGGGEVGSIPGDVISVGTYDSAFFGAEYTRIVSNQHSANASSSGTGWVIEGYTVGPDLQIAGTRGSAEPFAGRKAQFFVRLPETDYPRSFSNVSLYELRNSYNDGAVQFAVIRSVLGTETDLGSPATGDIDATCAVGDEFGWDVREENGSTRLTAYTNTGGGWIEQCSWLDATSTRPTNAGYIGGDIAGDVDVTFDNLKVRTVYSDYSAEVIADSPVAYYRLNETGETNLIANSSFETNLTGWDNVGGTLTRDTVEFHAGVASAKMVAVANDQMRNTAIGTVLPGVAYKCRFWIKGTASMVVRCQLDTETAYEEVTLTGSWQQFERTAEMIPTGSGDTLFFIAQGSGTFYLDEVEFFAIPLHDSSGNQHHVTAVRGTPNYGQASPIASDDTSVAIQLASDYFDIPDFDLANPNIFTLEAWVKLGADGVSNPILVKNSDAYTLWVNSDDQAILEQFGVGADTYASQLITADGNWYHLVATKDGSTRHFYVDGVDVTSLFDDLTFINNTSTLRIGENFFGDFFTGHLAELAIYDTALTAPRATAHYVTGIGKYGYEVLADSPNLWYRMNESSALFEPHDSTGNDHHCDQLGGTMTAYQTVGPLQNEVSLGQTFSGSSGYKFPNGAVLDVGDVFTMEAWVKRGAGQGTVQTIFLRDGAWQMYLSAANQLGFAREAVTGVAVSTRTITDTTTWHHCVITKNGSDVHLYIDGVDVTGSVTNSTFTNTGQEGYIGNNDFGGEWLSSGHQLSELALYPTALSSLRVQAHYVAGAAPTGPHGTPLLDDFNRPYEFPINSNWEQQLGGAGIEIANGICQTGNTPPATGSARWLTSLGADHEVWAEITNLPAADALALNVRMPVTFAGTDDYYELSLIGSGTMEIARRDNGSFALLDDVACDWQVGDAVALSVVGSTLKGWRRRNGTWSAMLEVEDATYGHAGYGVLSFGTNGGDLTWDNFGGGAIVGEEEEISATFMLARRRGR